jgi:hypothetical protein
MIISPDNTNINKTAYDDSVTSMNVIQNAGQGDCFFLAVADAINHYNYNNQNKRIISGRYGTGSNLFTQKYLRSLVAAYFLGSPDLEAQLGSTGVANADNLNEKFEQQMRELKNASGLPEHEDFSQDVYIRIANDTYTSYDNFLVQNVNAVPIIVDQYYRPFKPVNVGQVKSYIESNNYWANELAINALTNILRVNIIPLEYKKRENVVRIPFANFSSDNDVWDKYLFLYYSNKHYELMTFNFKMYTNGKIIDTNIEIFDRDVSNKISPPFYILLIIFGSYYSSILDIKNKETFTFYRKIMIFCENTINTTLYESDLYNNFYRIFKDYFPNSRINTPRLIGGQRFRPYSYPRYRNIYYQQPNRENEREKEKSQLAYYITIDLELYPGKSIPEDVLKNMKCQNKWNSVRKAYADFTGQSYKITPITSINNTNVLQKKEEQPTYNQTRYNQNQYDRTRRYPRYYGGKKSKTNTIRNKY